MAKRSPILGYNHNVRYRGLIFHVQTEDSGLLTPHLFTHLFYEGSIISTRKLVYDAGSDEGAIKSLMQAQHKAVMKDLKRGAFDEKMETNLAGIAGLLPRGATEPNAAAPLPDNEPYIPMPEAMLTEPGIEIIRDEAPADDRAIPRHDTAADSDDVNVTQPIEVLEELEPPPPMIARAATPPPHPVVARTKTPATLTIQPRNSGQRSESQAAPLRQPTPPPPPLTEIDPPTLTEDPQTLASEMFATSGLRPWTRESAPEIEIVPDEPPYRRSTRDTDIESLPMLSPSDGLPRVSDGVPGQLGMTGSGRSSAGLQPPPVPTSQRAPLSAATLPPSRPVTRPPSRPAFTPSAAVSRPATGEQERPRRGEDSDAAEVYASAPPSVETPPGMTERERAGQYSQHKRSRQFPVPEVPPTLPPPRERSSSAPIPAGLGRPLRPHSPSQENRAIPRPVSREPTPGPPAASGIPQPMNASHTLPRGKPPTPFRDRPPTPGRTPTPPRIQSTQPLQRPAGSGGVVMTRPAVIVGAPAKPTTQRVRKAREEEGRGFGQGLISEKSLDEVILAYLSEDADDK